MLIFNTFFRLLKRLKVAILIYTAIFLTLAVVMTRVLSTDNAKKFSQTSLTIGIVNLDDGIFGSGVEDYFSDTNKILPLDNDQQEIADKLYWREIDYALIIPKGFENSLEEDGSFAMDLQCVEVPGNYDSSLFQSELDRYLDKISGLVAGGMSLADAMDQMKEIREEEAEVQMASFINEDQGDTVSVFFSYAPYLFLSLGIIAISSVLIFFNESEVKKRMECSSMPISQRQTGLFAAVVAFGLALLVVVIAMACVFSNGRLLGDNRLPYFILNLFTILLFSVSLGFMAGNLFVKTESVNGFVNIVSLALCFLGGVFVPQEFFGAGVRQAAKFMPTYWYIKSNSMISSMTNATTAFQQDILTQNLIVLGETAVVFAVTMAVVVMRRKRG